MFGSEVAKLLNYVECFPDAYKKGTKILKACADARIEGGYGSVYKGKLHDDGHLVAVKVLNKSKGNGEEFINEVAAISRTSHVNIFIFDEKPQKNFDIKPHNILLDEHFSPKKSDFGLARVCTREESIISMLGARGTAGYIAPEAFCRNFGRVSQKSDVYSYEMMVLEMVGGRKNVNVGAKRRTWIEETMDEEDEVKVKKMIIVSLWCIQTDPLKRPAMSEVIEMLEGSLDSLQVPPKPFLSSPSRSQADTTTLIT
ncbi:hypothetical protein FEM48_Zijuj10G0141600 [Ziziphus jujuba var. spinosa]|uniref:Protein kinase domain-containing protein n=1 Tax=Ziziphus jujuba var. spinosa TaxID=714518 RepID=A0A978UNU8_ZIZJJ|nr:hypothetical protein FEM48_Zijuj10G0141600 [Ziziphus jujuba var. spinosa]